MEQEQLELTGINSPKIQNFEAVEEIIYAAREFLEELEHAEQSFMLWYAAFRMFRRKERAIGLPSANCKEGRLIYGSIVNLLRSLGQELLSYFMIHNLPLPEKAEYKDMESILSYLQSADISNEDPLSAEDIAILESAFSLS